MTHLEVRRMANRWDPIHASSDLPYVSPQLSFFRLSITVVFLCSKLDQHEPWKQFLGLPNTRVTALLRVLFFVIIWLVKGTAEVCFYRSTAMGHKCSIGIDQGACVQRCFQHGPSHLWLGFTCVFLDSPSSCETEDFKNVGWSPRNAQLMSCMLISIPSTAEPINLKLQGVFFF